MDFLFKTLLKLAEIIQKSVNDLLERKEIPHTHASCYYRKAHDYIKRAGASSDKLDILKMKIIHHQKLMVEKEMIPFQGSFNVPKQEIDAFLSQFEGKTITEIFKLICSLPLISYDLCKNTASQILGESLLGKLQNQLYVNGLLKAESSEEETIKLQAKWLHINENLILFSKISLLFEKLDKESPDFYDKLLEFFKNNAKFTEDMIGFIKIGIQKFR